eukprot:scaffold104591_cov69-Phaeocystis_antarctica.AAC.7
MVPAVVGPKMGSSEEPLASRRTATWEYSCCAGAKQLTVELSCSVAGWTMPSKSHMRALLRTPRMTSKPYPDKNTRVCPCDGPDDGLSARS